MATFKPGEIAPDSGVLVEVGPRGGKVPDGRRTVIEQGEKIPPTSEEGNKFKYQRGSKTTQPKE
ncbi:MAG: YjzC family protein [Candidatus Acidiferrales bacterium]